MEQQGHSEPGPVLRLTGPDLCPTCARVSLDLSEVDPVQDDESESYNMVNIYAILRGADGTASEKWRPTVSACRAGSAAGCPLCRFALAALERVSVGPGADVGDWLVDMSLCPVDPFYYKSSHELDIPAQPFGFRHSGPYAVGFNFANPNTGLPVYVKVSGYTEKGLVASLPTRYALTRYNREWIVSWLDECDARHSQCQPLTPGFVPSRLMFVGTLGAPRLRLVLLTQAVRYAALSYCWGDGNLQQEAFVLTGPVYQGRLAADMDFALLPKTLQDACSAARFLGVEYLWIDSLCILQDSLADWEVESSRMSDIYSNAYLTLAAASAPDVSVGMGLTRPTYAVEEMGLEAFEPKPARGTLLLVSPQPEKVSRVRSVHGPLFNRGWTLQEQLLSRRVLFFTDKFLYAECRESSRGESLFFSGFDPTSKIMRFRPRSSPDVASVLATADGDSIFDTWYHIVAIQYCRRKLTKQEDRLPAISGLARELTRLGDANYLAGLWDADITIGLLWRCHDNAAAKRSVEYRGPSWSWVSLDSKLPFYWRHDHRRGHGDEMTIIEAYTSPSGKDPTGRVDGGRLVVEGKMVDAVQVHTHRMHDRNGATVTPGREVGRSGWNYRLTVIDGDVDRGVCDCIGLFALVVRGPVVNEEVEMDEYRGLLLRKVGTTADAAVQNRLGKRPLDAQLLGPQGVLDVFERVGYWQLLHHDVESCDLTFSVAPQRVVLI